MSDLALLQGRTARWFLGPFKHADDTTYDLAGCELTLMAKSQMTDPDAQAKLTAGLTLDAAGTVTASSGMTLGGTDPTDGTDYPATHDGGAVTWEVTPAETASLAPGKYPWELVLTDFNGRIFNLLSGTITLTDTLIETP